MNAQYLVFSQSEQRGEALSTDGTHVVFGRPSVRLSVLTQPVLREERSGAYVALVVALDEVCLLLPRPWQVTMTLIIYL